jgi:carbonic anhydrase
MKFVFSYKLSMLIGLVLFLTIPISSLSASKYTAEQAVSSLKEGNVRFTNLKFVNTDYDKQIEHTKDQQHPFAAILSCMDSRVPPEVIFDQGIGNIFAVREAGNVISPNTLGSLEYAVNVKKVAVVVVLGHSNCGAVAAAVDGTDLKSYSNLEQLIAQIKPSTHNCKGNDYQCAEKNNIRLSIEKILKDSKTIADAVRKNEVKIIGAYYDVSNGVVTFDGGFSSVD